ncbi:hypothetical protein C2G38_1610459 [Gigaspora rosea]|uniref:TLDc domain-containing protein n=1 Tax=Gigaspora rosea TaxID=44941 RepID=A0A397V6T0_9GLOM|nr:hypothetical protein C2G38_1610459 [Gigaspora rosea]
MLIASEFLLEELTKYLETHLIETKANWLRLHFKSIYQKSFQNEPFKELQKWCNDFLVKYPDKIFDSEDFTSLQENALVSLIKRDDLQIEEVKIWNYVIKWGIAQNQNLPSNPKNWTQENFLILKTTLQNWLPHIRYFQISGDDIIDNIKPYHQILDENLWDDILKRAINPNRQIPSTILSPRIILEQKLPLRESFSTIINKEHAAEIATWVDKKAEAYSVTNNPYEFKLLLRGTRDGFTKESFWNLCDKQVNTIVVVKVNDTDEILGGYNPVGWDKSINNWVYCNDSFIFSLKNGTINSSTLSRVKNPKNAIYSHSSYGPSFDDDFWMTKVNNPWSCSIRSYEKAIRNVKTKFLVSEYEVFQIQKK